MGHVYYNKLIRDKIPEKIEQKGETCEVRALDGGEEFKQELLKKVTEEARGLSKVRTRESFLDELADILEVLDALKSAHGITDAEVESAREQNQKMKGGFAKRFFLHWSSDETYKSNETPQGIQQ